MSGGKKKPEPTPLRELLSRKAGGAGPHPLRPLDHLAFAILEKTGARTVVILEVLSRLRRDFVDWNEIRVTRVQELARHLTGLEQTENAAAQIKTSYNAFFDKKGCLSFAFLALLRHQEARRALTQAFPALAKGALSLLLHEVCPDAPLPFTENLLKQARKDGVIGKNADRQALTAALAAGLSRGDIGLLLQYWEIEASGHPYGAAAKSAPTQPGGGEKKTPAKAVAPARSGSGGNKAAGKTAAPAKKKK